MKDKIQNIINWAKEKDLLKKEIAPKQYLKFLEELGETARAILKGNKDEIVDGLGDVGVTIIILAEQLGCTYEILENQEYSISFDVSAYLNHLTTEVNSSNVGFDSLSVLNSACLTQGFTLDFCLACAWEEIKDRKGKTVNGTFVKA